METIKSAREFQRVYQEGKQSKTPLVRMVFIEDDSAQHGKIAFVAAKRLGNAVFRNRCKRLLRESARQSGLPVAGWSIILFATNNTHDAAQHEITSSLEKLLVRCGIK